MSTKNGTATEETKPSKIQELHAAWVKNGAKDPSEAISKKLVGEYKAALKAKTAAEKALEKARHDLSLSVENLILNHGKGRLRIGGEVCIPMGRLNKVTGIETLFFRGEGTGEVKDLG